MKQLLKAALIVILFLSVQNVAVSGTYQDWKGRALSELSTTPIDDEGTTAYAYRQDTKTMRNLLNKRWQEAHDLLKEHGRDPVLLWILGELGALKHTLYVIDIESVGKFYQPNAPESRPLIKEYSFFYQKALELDDDPNAPDHLTVMMLNNIGSDSVGDPAIKVKALEKAAALARAGKNVGGSELFEWNTYEARVGIYVDAEDYENALKIVNEMLDRFPNYRTDELLRWKHNIEDKISERQQEAVAKDNDADTYTQPQAVDEPAKAVKSKKPAVEKQPGNGNESVWLFVLLAVLLIGAGAFFIRRRGKGES